jgi:hypothetical protein
MTLRSMMEHPSAYLPAAMSLVALATVLGFLARFGVAHAPDENAAAHIWQLLMAGQVPIVAFFAIKWLPRAPRMGLLVLVLQSVAALAAFAPVYVFKL